MIQTVNIGVSANDGTGDPLRTAFNKLNTNFLNITADGGDEITVTDPTTSTDQTLNDALANIYASGGGGSVTSVNGDTGVVVVDLQSATDEGNTITDGTDTNTISANTNIITDGTDSVEMQKTFVKVYDFSLESNLNKNGLSVSDGTNSSQYGTDVLLNDGAIDTRYGNGAISYDGVNYPLPTGASSQIATLADITGGVTDGDKGDITVSSSGTVWTVDNQAITKQKLEHIQTAHVLGRHASGTGDVQEVSPTQLRTILNVEDGAQVNNISDTNATDLTDGGDTTLHTHDSRYYTETEIDTFLNLRVRTLLNDNVDSSAVTGTVSNTIFKSYLIPANTLAVGDTIDVKAVCSKTGTNANCNFRLYTNTANSLTSASALALVSPSATNLYFSLDRTYTLKSGNTLESFPVGATAPTDEVATTTAISNTAFNPTVDNYFIVAIQPNSTSDSFKQTLFYMTLMKQKTSI